MKTITLRELHLATGVWVRRAARKEPIVITDRGRPIAALTSYDPLMAGKSLPDREKKIHKRSAIRVESSVYLDELRDR